MRALVAFAIAVLASPSLAHAAATSGDVHELARALVEIGDERPRMAKTVESIAADISSRFSMELSLTDPAVAGRVNEVVHQTLAPVSDKAGDAMVEAFAANFTAQELGDVLTYMNSPAAKAEKANLPLLGVEMGAAYSDDSSSSTIQAAAQKVYDSASPTKRELILRILKAQNFEATTRKGYAIIGEVMKAGYGQVGRDPSDPSPSPAGTTEDDREADAYVRLMTAVFKRNYVEHFSEADLSTAAAYLESHAGQAMVTRTPLVKRAVGKVLADQFVSAIRSLDGKVCAVVHCTAEQQARIAEETKDMAWAMALSVGEATK